MKPRISVVITVFDGARTLRRALDSLVKQSLPPHQVVVVDDGSADESANVARSYQDLLPLTVIEPRQRLGRAVALNRAVEASTSEFIAILDADDYALHDRLEVQAEYLSGSHNCGMVGSAFYQLVTSPRLEVRQRSLPLDDATLRKALAYSGPFCHSSVVYSRRAIVDAGGFDPRRRSRVDQDLWIRIARLGFPLANLARPYVIHYKDDGTYFARVNRPSVRTTSMLARNFSAVFNLDLPSEMYLVAAARSAVSFVPKRAMSRITAGATVGISDDERLEDPLTIYDWTA